MVLQLLRSKDAGKHRGKKRTGIGSFSLCFSVFLLFFVCLFVSCSGGGSTNPAAPLEQRAASQKGKQDVAAASGWQLVEMPFKVTLNAVHMFSEELGWAVGDRGTVLCYRDGVWEKESSPTPDRLNAVWALRSDLVWAVGEGGVIIQYNGVNWQEVKSGSQEDLSTVIFYSEREGYAAGEYGTILVWNGMVWEQLTDSPVSEKLYAGAVAGREHIWLCGQNSVLLYYQGESWQQVETESTYDLYGMAMERVDHGWAIGDYGEALLCRDGRWERRPTAVEESIYAIDYERGGSCWAVGAHGLLLHYSDGRWDRVASPTNEDLFGIDVLDIGKVVAVGGAGTIIGMNLGGLKRKEAKQEKQELSFQLKSVVDGKLKPGDKFKYELVLLNGSDDLLTDVYVCDTLPAGLVFKKSKPKPSCGSEQQKKGLLEWQLEDVEPGKGITLKLEVKIDENPAAKIVNRALLGFRRMVIAAEEAEPERDSSDPEADQAEEDVDLVVAGSAEAQPSLTPELKLTPVYSEDEEDLVEAADHTASLETILSDPVTVKVAVPAAPGQKPRGRQGYRGRGEGPAEQVADETPNESEDKTENEEKPAEF